MKIITLYEFKVLGRSFNFIIAAVTGLCIIIGLLLIFQSDFNAFPRWALVGLPAAFPFMGIYYLNFVQVLLVLFVSGSFWFKNKEKETVEVFLVRPESNMQYLFGKFFGSLTLILLFDLIVMVIGALVNVCLSAAPFYYIFYFMALLVPHLIFLLGITFFLKNLFRSPYFAFTIVTGVLIILSYFSRKGVWEFDFMGNDIPNLFSDRCILSQRFWRRSCC